MQEMGQGINTREVCKIMEKVRYFLFSKLNIKEQLLMLLCEAMCWFFQFYSQARAFETDSSVEEIHVAVNEEINECQHETEMDVKQICGHMKYCKFEQFKVLMIKLDMGIEKKDTVGSARDKISPFTNIYFYDKNNCSEAKEMQWSDVPVFPVPE
jgi:menaquinone-dependent protoporphyrinogen IX oxidase